MVFRSSVRLCDAGSIAVSSAEELKRGEKGEGRKREYGRRKKIGPRGEGRRKEEKVWEGRREKRGGENKE
jgi:hypothetical protein